MNCEYCGSRIFDSDRVCDRCGAPNKIVSNSVGVRAGSINKDIFGDLIRAAEENEPAWSEVKKGFSWRI